MDKNIVAISDTHGLHRGLNLPEGDMIIHAGDVMTNGYKLDEVQDFLNWYSSLNFKYKILVAGNHDRLFENSSILVRSMIANYPDIIYLENKGCEIEGIKIWGTPDSKRFCGWAFNRTEEHLEIIFSKIPDDTQILISHAPAFDIGDKLESGERVGEKTLLNKIGNLKNLIFHFFGHVHHAYGVYGCENYIAYNCSVVNEAYQLQNKPHVIKNK